jgi:hypothetical protein
MKSKKLLEKLNSLMGLSENADKAQVKQLRKVLKSLKKRQDELITELESADAEQERRKLQQKIDVIQLQREKGVEVYKKLKKARDE